ncbi:MAG TPA: DUF3800 domain-containing protein [bacterium]|nr:DUF3800 domain-containing protein [bacterium]
MGASFRCYIDESGCEGFKFGAGSSRWFIQSAVIVRKINDNSIIQNMRKIRELFEMPPKKPVHWKRLKHDKKVVLADKMASLPIRCIAVAVDKTALLEPEKFTESYRLYFYSIRFLLERVSWLARDSGKGSVGDGKIELVFSNRSGMSYEKLDQYLRKLKNQRDSGIDIRIEFDFLDLEGRKTWRPGKSAGLQAADAYAGSLFNALEPNRYGNVETRYIATFKPVIYNRQGNTWGYGIKITPREAIEGVKRTELYRVLEAGPGP